MGTGHSGPWSGEGHRDCGCTPGPQHPPQLSGCAGFLGSPFQPPPATGFTKNKTQTPEKHSLWLPCCGGRFRCSTRDPVALHRAHPSLTALPKDTSSCLGYLFPPAPGAGLLFSHLLPKISARTQNSVLLPRFPAVARTSSNASELLITPRPSWNIKVGSGFQSMFLLLCLLLPLNWNAGTMTWFSMLPPCTQSPHAGLVYGHTLGVR